MEKKTKRLILGLLACLSYASAFGQMPASHMPATEGAQEQDTLPSTDKMMALQEIVVKGSLPNTRMKGNGMVTRIQGTPLASSGSLGEMLVKVPGMTGTEESPEVLGKGSPIIYVNGRQLRNMDELKRLRSEDIRDVEVINNPSARYDATVKAVVRIRTKRQQGDGLSLDLMATDEQDLRYGFNKPYGQLGMNYRTNGVDIFGSVYYYHQDYRQYSSIEEATVIPNKEFYQAGPYTMTWRNDELTYTAGTNWQISDNHSVGIRTDLTHFLGGTNKVIYDEDVFENNVRLDHLYSEQTSKESRPLSWLTNAYYNGTAGKLGIDFNFDFMNSEINTDRENIENGLTDNDLIRSKSGTKSHLYATKLVLSYPIWKGSLELGTEMTFAKRHNTYWIDKPSIPNTDADIKENNLAAFVEYGCIFDKLGQASVGMRYEHTLYDYDDQKNRDFLHRSMDEFFPTAAYSVSLGKVQTALSYSIKTNRPTFFAMNDAVTYISRYTMQAGNSQLLNERLRDLTLNISWRWLTLTTSYERCKNAITQWAILGDDDAVLIKHTNHERPVKVYSAYLTASPRIGIWSLNATTGIQQQDFHLDLHDECAPDGIRRAYFNKPIYTLHIFNTLNLKHNWKIDVNFQYSSQGHQQNSYNDYNSCRLSLVAQKSFLKDKSLTLRAALYDILQRSHMNECCDMGYYRIQQNNRFSNHKFRLTVSYRLNSTRSKYKGTGAGKETQKRMKN